MKLTTPLAMGAAALLVNGASASQDFFSTLFDRHLEPTCPTNPSCKGNVRPIALGVGTSPAIKLSNPYTPAFDDAYFANAQNIPLYESGQDRADKEVICQARLAQTCSETCNSGSGSFVYIQVKCTVELLTSQTGDFYVKTGASTNLVTPSGTFEFIGTSGFEAKFCIPNGVFTPLNIHAQYRRPTDAEGVSRTASTGKPGGAGYQICVRPICPPVSCPNGDSDCCVTNTGGAVCLSRSCSGGVCVESPADCPCSSDSGCFTGECCTGGKCIPCGGDPGTGCASDADCNDGPIPDSACSYYECKANVCSDQLTYRGSAHECRPAADLCDAPEYCVDNVASCPEDLKKASGEVCRDKNGLCDVAEKCNGVDITCPTDGFLALGEVCRASTGLCDITEVCTGTSPDCPADAMYEFGYSYKCATDQYLCGLTNSDVGKTTKGSSLIYNVEKCVVGSGPPNAIQETYDTCKTVSTEPIFQPLAPQGPGSDCPNGHGISNFAYAECVPSLNKWVCCGKCDVVKLEDGITEVYKCTTYDHPECDLALPEYIGGRRLLRGHA